MAMSSWQNIKAEDLDLDGDEINIHYDDDSSGALYLVVKVKDIKKLLAVRDERNEESVCYCAEINSRNCPKHQNSEESADYTKPEWGGWKIISDMLDNPDENGIYPTSKAYQQLYDFVVSQKQQAIQAERTRIIKALKGLKKEKHDHISDFIPEDHDDYRWALRDISADIALAYNSAIDQAIKAVEEKE